MKKITFCNGDNRANSEDSRRNIVGTVSKDRIVGVLCLIQGYVNEINTTVVDGELKTTYKGKHFTFMENAEILTMSQKTSIGFQVTCKGIRLIKERLKLVDIVLELCDARFKVR